MNSILQTKVQNTFKKLIKWLIICVIISILIGSVSALFLFSLEWVTNNRISNSWMIFLLPVGGLFIGLMYHYYGKEVQAGNNLLLEEIEKPQKKIPFLMAPLVLVGTLITHWVGGSAGREGTAVQMGGAISDLFSKYYKIHSIDRKILLFMGISGGFASVFGTPWAGFLFAFEINKLSKKHDGFIIPVLIAAFGSDFVCHAWQISHTVYEKPVLPAFSWSQLGLICLGGITFGLAAWAFSRNMHFWKNSFQRWIAYPPFRPMVGGLVLLGIFHFFPETTPYQGLGIPVIQNAFLTTTFLSVAILKMMFTGFTLGAGFKGGEVTPLFFIGAALGSSLSGYFDLPIAFMAGLGFVAVFAGATHTPWASAVMGMELFGWELGGYFILVCWMANLSSGTQGIYESQNTTGFKAFVYRQKFLFLSKNQ